MCTWGKDNNKENIITFFESWQIKANRYRSTNNE